MSRMPTKEGLLKWVDDYAAEQDLDARETLILTKFASYADAAMETWAAIKTLARQGRSSERKVQYVLRDFEAAGVIRRTDRMHRIADSNRDVPLYVFSGYLDSLTDAASTGARRAPMRADGCTDGGVTGAQGVHPHNELIEPTPSDEGDAHAREGLFERLEAAFPKRALSFGIQHLARAEFFALLDRGVDAGRLIQAAANWAADPKGKKSEVGLQYWLKDGRYRGTWPEPQLALEREATAARPSDQPGAATAADQTFWDELKKRMIYRMSEEEFGAYLGRAYLGEAGGQLYLVAFSTMAKQRLLERRRRQLVDTWAEVDPQRRPLSIVSKSEFEALRQRQSERVS